MKLHTIETGFFKLDGGAMFGVVPKSIWQKLNQPDNNNLCTWAMRCLLIEDGKRLILIDTGCGDKQDISFFKHYYLHGEDTLIKSIRRAGFEPYQITDVILTHLHFDHVGGALSYNSDRSGIFPTFQNAVYWIAEAQWLWANDPNPREGASFLKDNIQPLAASGQLRFITSQDKFSHPDITFFIANGHTEAMLIPKIKYRGTTLCYAADLLPSVGHIPLPYIMSYDVRPLESMAEKSTFLQQALDEKQVIFYEHDPNNECSNVIMTEKGIRVGDIFKLEELR